VPEKDINTMNGAVRLALYIVIYLTLFFLHRSNCEEGEQDASDEYGHAGGAVGTLSKAARPAV
jgi:hypothetical protein